MKKLKMIIGLLFLAITTTVQQSLLATHEIKNTQEAIEQVDKKISLFDQIIAQAAIIVKSSDQTDRTRAKKEITRLMKHKELPVQIKDSIKDDIEIIKTGKTSDTLDEAYQRLLDTYKQINTQADGIETIIEATEMVQNASPDELEDVIAQAQEKIEQSEQEQGFATRMYAKAKRLVTAPVDYVFGEEASYLKTAFYTAVGLAVVAAGVYGGYRYANVLNNQQSTEKAYDAELQFLDKMIATSSHSRKNAPVNSRYQNEVESKSKYQIEKYVHEREKELKQKLITSDDKKTIENQLYALKEFKYFFFEKDLVPGGEHTGHTATLLRDPNNLSNNSPYLRELTDIMLTYGGSKISLMQKETGKFDNIRDAKNARQEFLRTLHEYTQRINENEETLSKKINIPADRLYKAGLSSEQLNKIKEVEKSVKKPFLKRFFGSNPFYEE